MTTTDYTDLVKAQRAQEVIVHEKTQVHNRREYYSDLDDLPTWMTYIRYNATIQAVTLRHTVKYTNRHHNHVRNQRTRLHTRNIFNYINGHLQHVR